MSATIADRPDVRPAATRSGISFALKLDHDIYLEPGIPQLDATLTLLCPTATPVSLTFVTGQQFDLEILDASGQQVGLWSKGRVFPDLVRTVTIKGEQKWTASMALPVREGGDPLDAAYTLTGYLTTAGAPTDGGGVVRAYSATVGFIVRARPVVLTQPAQ